MLSRHPDAAPRNPGRREFLRDTLAGSLLLATGALGGGLSGCSRQDGAEKRFLLLRESDVPLIEALMAVIVGPRLPDPAQARSEALEQAVFSYDSLLYHTSAARHEEILELFDLLKFPLTRIIFAGVWQGWSKAPEEEVRGFLARWKSSDARVLNQAYDALVRTTQQAWYAVPGHLAASSYPGPPPHARALFGN